MACVCSPIFIVCENEQAEIKAAEFSGGRFTVYPHVKNIQECLAVQPATVHATLANACRIDDEWKTVCEVCDKRVRPFGTSVLCSDLLELRELTSHTDERVKVLFKRLIAMPRDKLLQQCTEELKTARLSYAAVLGDIMEVVSYYPEIPGTC
jgi:hypothetical protein